MVTSNLDSEERWCRSWKFTKQCIDHGLGVKDVYKDMKRELRYCYIAMFGNNTTLGAQATEVKAAQIVFIKVFNKMLLIIVS